MEISQILVCRENKSNLIKSYTKDYQVVTLKANIVGENKNMKEAYILLSYFDKLLPSNYLKKQVLDDLDGPMIIYLYNLDKSLKEDMILIEQNNSLGRFIDIDVYFNDTKSLNRTVLRKCYLCDNPAFVCGRNKTHTVEELNNYLKQEVFNHLSNTITNLCDQSMMAELNLHPKFGLVTPYTNGSHKDMDYDLMIKAKKSILPYFSSMIKIGYNSDNLKQIFQAIRKIGIEAEKNMFLETNGINAYKGLIFALGLAVTSVTNKISNLKQKRTWSQILASMTQGITKELEQGNETFGKIAYKKYNIKGARHQAELGFPIVNEVINKYNLDNDETLLKALCYLISNIDDTVLLKRCNDIKLYNQVKTKFKELDCNKENINDLNEYCINNNLSFGGSADLLIVSVFIKKINQLFNFDLFQERK